MRLDDDDLDTPLLVALGAVIVIVALVIFLGWRLLRVIGML